MKRFTLILLTILLAVGSLGCQKDDVQLQKPAKFYYRNEEINYGTEDGLIAYELQETSHIGADLYQLILQYQKGPVSESLVNPLSQDINITAVENYGGVITVSTDTSFHQLSGIDRSVACACISMTLLDYTEAKYIKFYIVDDFLGEKESLIFSRKDMQLLDNLPSTTQSN